MGVTKKFLALKQKRYFFPSRHTKTHFEKKFRKQLEKKIKNENNKTNRV